MIAATENVSFDAKTNEGTILKKIIGLMDFSTLNDEQKDFLSALQVNFNGETDMVLKHRFFLNFLSYISLNNQFSKPDYNETFDAIISGRANISVSELYMQKK